MAGINWAEMNPFSRADRGQLSPPSTGQQPNKKGSPTDNPDDPNNTDPTKKTTNQPGPGDDPLLKFESLWQPNVDKDGKPLQSNDPNNSPYLPQLDPKKLDGMVNGMDFTRGIAVEDWKAIGEGGEAAIGAVAKIMNHVGRQAFRHSFQASNKLAEAGFGNARERFVGDIPNHVRDIVVDNELAADNPIMKNPAFAPLVNTVKQQYLDKFPKATPADLNNAVRQYFAYLAKEMNIPNKDKTQTDSNTQKLRKGSVDADFEQWLGEDIKAPGMFNDQTGEEDLQQ